jgi:subtilisin family serine protease
MPSTRRHLIRFGLTLWLAAAALWLIRPAVSASPTIDPADPIVPPAPTISASQPFTLTPELARKLQPELLKQLLSQPNASSSDVPIIIMLRPAAHVNLSSPQLPANASMIDRRAALVNDLQAVADQSQIGVRSFLASAESAGRAADVRSLWINNSLAARVDRSIVPELAARTDIALIALDHYRHWVDWEPVSDLAASNQVTSTVEWGIAKIEADKVWSALGITGTGVVVANMDTGVDWQHPALLQAYRGYNPKGLPNHLYSWIDTTGGGALYPYDGYGHGTHTMGTLVGSGGIGVAPGAKWDSCWLSMDPRARRRSRSSAGCVEQLLGLRPERRSNFSARRDRVE